VNLTAGYVMSVVRSVVSLSGVQIVMSFKIFETEIFRTKIFNRIKIFKTKFCSGLMQKVV